MENGVKVLYVTVKLDAPWLGSLKEKRSICKSLMAKLSSKFNVSVAETGCQDTIKTIMLSVASIASSTAQADSIYSSIIAFIESTTDAQIMWESKELL